MEEKECPLSLSEDDYRAFNSGINKKLIQLRKEHKYTQRYIADYLGTSTGNICHYEREVYPYPMRIVYGLSRLYDVPISYIICGSAPTKEQKKELEMQVESLSKEATSSLLRIQTACTAISHSLSNY